VLTGSTAGRWVYDRGGAYVAAKHALAALRDTLRLELVEAVYAGVDALVAEDVAEVIAWAASRPPHVNIDLVQVTPQQQAPAHKVVRRS
jgi:NADP-dependent 3-hydroxy acid dehydrogenase YdfG